MAEIRVEQSHVQVEQNTGDDVNVSQFIIQIEHGPLPDETFDETARQLTGQRGLSIYLNKTIDATKLFEQINAAVGTYLFNDYDGKFRYVLYSQLSGEASLSFVDRDIFSIEEVTDASDIVSKVKAKYRHRLTRDYWQVYVFDKPSSQYLSGSPVAITKELELPYTESSDAGVLAQRTVLHEGARVSTYKAVVSHRGWKLLPSDFVQITSTKMGVNATLEVLEVEPDFLGNTTTLLLSGQRGLVSGTGNPGFWMSPTPVFPGGDLGTGSVAVWDNSWTDEQKQWARQNCGFWCDASGHADPTDIDSYNPSSWQ